MHITEKPIPPSLSHKDITAIVIGIILAMFLSALDQTIIATAMPTIGKDLGDADQVSWVASVYLLTATAVTPLYGKLSDIHGRRSVLLIAIVIFTLGSIACGLAPTMLTLIAARAVQGLGGGGLISLAQTIIADIIAPKERGRYQVYIAGVFVSASLAGPVLGGLFTEYLHWSMIFWINIPLGIVAYAMTSNALTRLPRHERPHELDILGTILMIAATVSLMLALSLGGTRFTWASPQIIVLFVTSAVFWVLFGLRLAKAREPLIPVELLANPTVRNGTLSAFFGMGTYIGLTIYMPQFFESVLGLRTVNSGFALIPLMLGTVVGATLSGRVMIHMKHYKRLPIAGLLLAALGMIILAVFESALSLIWVEVIITLVSLGLGTLLPVTTVSIQNAVLPYQMGTATGTMNFFRSLGSALIVAGFSAILLGGAAVVNGHADHVALEGEAAVRAFRQIFTAALVGYLCALWFLIRMEERPLRSGSEPPQITE